MEVMLRCEVPDRPGTLSRLAGAIAEAGGNIEAVDVVESADGRALDDLVVVVSDVAMLEQLVRRLDAEPDIRVVHGGPSRGHPGDAVSRVAIKLEALLVGALTFEHALETIVGGQLRAATADVIPYPEAPRPDVKTMVIPVDDRVLVLRRDYRFTDTERTRADALVRVCLAAYAGARTG